MGTKLVERSSYEEHLRKYEVSNDYRVFGRCSIMFSYDMLGTMVGISILELGGNKPAYIIRDPVEKKQK